MEGEQELSSESTLVDRVLALEEHSMHQNKLVHDLNDVIVELRLDVDRLQRTIEQQRQRINWLTQNLPETEQRSMEDDRPPHY